MLTYSELLEEFNRLKEENAKLKAEIAALKSISVSAEYDRNSEPEPETALPSSAVNKYSSPADKVKLFRSLFSGRVDVFAKRWYSRTTEKSGYQPVCGNEWGERLLEGRDAYGRDVVGIYPMLTDETVNGHFCHQFEKSTRVLLNRLYQNYAGRRSLQLSCLCVLTENRKIIGIRIDPGFT